MVPNLDLLFVALIHGSFICCMLLVIICLFFVCLLLASFLVLMMITSFDAYETLQSVSWLIDAFKGNLELGLVLLLCISITQTIKGLLALQPVLESLVSKAKARAWRGLDRLKNLALKPRVDEQTNDTQTMEPKHEKM